MKAPQHRGTLSQHQHDVARVRVRVEEPLAEQRDADGVRDVLARIDRLLSYERIRHVAVAHRSTSQEGLCEYRRTTKFIYYNWNSNVQPVPLLIQALLLQMSSFYT